MPAARQPPPARAAARAPCSSPTSSTRSARCPAIPRSAIAALLAEQPGLTVAACPVEDLLLDAQGAACGVASADGRTWRAGAVVLTTGTFLRGEIHLGLERWPAGRLGDAPAVRLAQSLERAGFALRRLKTGTPPRLDGRTIDFAGLERPPGD